MADLIRLKNREYDPILGLFYGKEEMAIREARERYLYTAQEFERLFGLQKELSFFSAPGRTEIGGNHTDHQHGCVLAAAVDLDIIAAAAPNQQEMIRFQSEGFPRLKEIDSQDTAFRQEEQGTSSALIRGICARIQELGYRVGGFDAYSTSRVWQGSGLSSSAAFEILVITIINYLFNEGAIPAVQAAQIAQYAENVYFGKPSGLMDQMACSVGGFVAMDFQDPQNPVLEKIEFNPTDYGYKVCIVNTGGSHADLTMDYAQVSEEMKSLARAMGCQVLRECKEKEFLTRLSKLREMVGDRAILRGFHFFEENKRAIGEKEALKQGDFDQFKKLCIDSGRSSFMFLQNVYSSSFPREQGIALALAITEKILKGKGAWRVHGGGFAGTIQAFVPLAQLEQYQGQMKEIFGKESCHIVTIRKDGGVKIF